MDFSFIIFVFPFGIIFGAYVFYWLIRGVVEEKHELLTYSIEKILSEWRSVYFDEVRDIAEEMRKIKDDINCICESIGKLQEKECLNTGQEKRKRVKKDSGFSDELVK